MNVDLKKYSIKPIGILTATKDGLKAEIFKKYIPALKNLNLFSHILIITNNINNNDIHKDTELNNLHNRLLIHTAKVLAMNKDEIELESSYLFYGKFNIYDIKPYFPCEDRVKDAIAPKLTDWINEYSTDANQMSINQPIQLDSIGLIKKVSGQYTLSLPNYKKGELEKLDEYSHLKVVWLFSRFTKDRYKRKMLVKPPYENAPKSGIFATRSPVRPNPIAITIAKILEINYEEKTITVNALDAFNKTPIIDIVPYIPKRDLVSDFKVPSYLEHWPEWYQDSITEFKIDINKFPLSNRDIIKRYSKPNNTNVKVDFEKCIQRCRNSKNKIIIKGAKQNNLKNIDVSIPKNKLTVITGVSGSGKSSLAFDTLYAESQRRFLDNLSDTSSSISEMMKKPDVDQITGLPPAIAIKQNSMNRNMRSTVGTITDINDYLRVLFAKIGLRRCPQCGRSIEVNTANDISRIIYSFIPNTNIKIRAFNSTDILLNLNLPENQNQLELDKKQIDLMVGKGLKQGKGAISVLINNDKEVILQTKNMCFHCDYIFFEMTATDFSFNNPESMCSECNGLGVILKVDPELIIARTHLSILDNASEWWGNLRQHRKKPNANWMRGEILALAQDMNVDLELPWCDLPQEFRNQAMYGSSERVVSFIYKNSNGRKGEINRPVEGAFNTINRLFKSGKSSGESIAKKFMRKQICQKCNGERLNTASRLVSISGIRFPEVMKKNITELQMWILNVHKSLSEHDKNIASPILQEVNSRIENLINVGVPYLCLNRSIPTLSGGELQRIRLASQLNNGLSDLLYILDEPSMGLHAYDNKKLINTLLKIRDNENTVVVVEHDKDTMLASDYIIDIGPQAGVNGGEIIAEGAPCDIAKSKTSITGKYLKETGLNRYIQYKNNKADNWLSIIGACENNLNNINVNIPLGVTTCITGVSGSGKSSLLLDTLYPALQKALGLSAEAGGKFKELKGIENIDNVLRISQTPIGRTPRSNPATYTGVFDEIRALFAKTENAKKLGYKKSCFSFNSKDGQCEDCKGEGRKRINMHFMPDIWVLCDNCKGKRYKENILKVKFNNQSIADILDMDIYEANTFFEGYSKITNILQTLCDVGLGYLKLGQSALTLSGGEAQRVKLAKELSKPNTGKTVYLLDEPTTGLHFEDINKLSLVFNRIVKDGNSLLIIEHNLDVIKKADWIIDMGPFGGDQGGSIVAEGTPKQIMECEESITGKMLRKEFRGKI